MCCIFHHIGIGRDKRGQPIDVWVNSNADNVELFLNGKSLGKKDMPRNGHLQWSVNYEPGTLEAVAYKNARPDDPVGREGNLLQKWKQPVFLRKW